MVELSMLRFSCRLYLASMLYSHLWKNHCQLKNHGGILPNLQESEWLRITLHKWLDDEYCPEPTNFEISKLAAQSYYESLLSKETNLGEILLKMVRQLETISYQQSFHGPFSSANAAVHLITRRIDSALEH